MSTRHMMRSTGVIGMATAISRVLGFVRDILFARYFGTSVAAQAFVVAFRIPNSLRDLVGEGAMNSAIVPVLSSYRVSGEEKEFVRASKVLFNIALGSLTVMTVLGILFSPAIIRLIAPGFMAEPEKFSLTVSLNRAIFPYLILIGLTAYSMGVLNTLRHFAAPAFGPALMNVAMIVSFAFCAKYGVAALAVGVLAGGAAQLALNLPFLYKHGISVDFREGTSHAAVGRIGRLLGPRVLGTAVYQVNIFVDTILASLGWIVGAGGVAAIYYANRLIQFPLGIFGIALAQAALPKLSQEFAASDLGRFKDTVGFSIRAIILIMLPASFALAVLGRPIIKILFERGEFTVYSTAITGSALFFYAFGLLAYGGIKLLVTAFYSMHDTITPVRTALAAVIINVVLNLILMWPLKLGGLALATSISATCNFVMLYTRLRRKVGDFGTAMIADTFGRVLLASGVMAILLKAVSMAVGPYSVAGLLLSISVGAASFAAACFLFRVREARDFAAWIIKRR